MLTALFTASGIACVAWTAFELTLLSRGRSRAPRTSRDAGAPDAPSRAEATRSRSGRFAAWDDRGRPIDVEDLGSRAPTGARGLR